MSKTSNAKESHHAKAGFREDNILNFMSKLPVGSDRPSSSLAGTLETISELA